MSIGYDVEKPFMGEVIVQSADTDIQSIDLNIPQVIIELTAIREDRNHPYVSVSYECGAEK